MKPQLHLATLLGALTALVVSSAFAAENPKPNIIHIMVDEPGYFEAGFMGNKLLHTPNMDRLAASGVIMMNLFSGGQNCAPARATLLTGKHTGHTSVRGNSGDNSLRADEKTTAEVLKTQGYATGGFGKWGIGGRDSTGVPEKHGFDVFFGYYDQVHAHTYYPPYLIRNSEEVPLPGNHGGTQGQTYAQYQIHDAALKFIREHAGKQPFFAYLPYTPPHGIYAIPDNDPALARYQDKPWPKDAILYAAMNTMVDREIGEVLDLLKSLNIESNTLVFFSGDNGGQERFVDAQHPHGLFSPNKDPNGPTEFRGWKGGPYEGGIRVYFAATWPGKIAPGRVSQHLGYFPDMLPTMAEAAGATVPKEVDGVSFLPELIGEPAAGRKQAQHDYLYWESDQWEAIRQGDWRAVNQHKTKKWELYNVATAANESQDVAAQHPEMLAKLQALAKAAHDPMLPGNYSTRERADRDRRPGRNPAATPKKGKTKAKTE